MCGRYYIPDAEENNMLRAILRQADLNSFGLARARGDIFPSNAAPVVSAVRGTLCAHNAVWGLKRESGGLIINARSETAAKTPSFKRLIRSRCAVPCGGFYEWSRPENGKKGVKTRFTPKEGLLLYMAGLIDVAGAPPRFVILTVAANQSVAPVHSRMPVLLEKEQVRPFLLDDGSAFEMLTLPQPELFAVPEPFERAAR